VVILPLKWIVVRISRDPEAEAGALLAVPEDLWYVTLGLLLGDINSNSGAFRRYFARSSHASIDIVIAVSLNLAIALMIHRLARWVADHFRNWRAAGMARASNLSSQQMELPLETADENIKTLMIRHLFLFLVGYLGQLALVLIWLHCVAKVISSV
jgi:hypothetical protein